MREVREINEAELKGRKEGRVRRGKGKGGREGNSVRGEGTE